MPNIPRSCEEMRERRKHEHTVDEVQRDFQNDKPKGDDERAFEQRSKESTSKTTLGSCKRSAPDKHSKKATYSA